MSNEIILQCSNSIWSNIYTAIAAIAAIIAAICAIFSYRLSKKIYDEIKSDEVIITGPLHHPGLQCPDHDKCVLRCAVFNKSHRKAYIKSVDAFDSQENKIEITWSDNIDNVGNILDPMKLLGVRDSIKLYMRRNDGERFGKTTVFIEHSFSSKKIAIIYDPYSGWEELDPEQ